MGLKQAPYTMPPKGYRKSMPGRLNSTMLTPSRRSPRVPAKTTNSSPQSSKSLDSSTDSPDSSFNIRFFNPKTPSKSSSTNPNPGAGSPDLSLSHRRTFQARPSRLSTVFTPAVETPTSTISRRTRRSTANTVQNQFSDDDFAETGWTLEQYLGLGYEEDLAGQTSPTKSSSMGTLTSARVRKPTERFLESQTSQPKPHRKNATVPVAVEKQPTKKIQKSSQKRAIAPKNAVKAISAQKGKQVKKNAELERIKIKEDDAAQGLHELARDALGPDFEIPEDHNELIDELRAAYFKRESEVKATRDAQDALEAQKARDALDAQLDEYDDSDDDAVNNTEPIKASNSAKPPKDVKTVKDDESLEPVNPNETLQTAEASRDTEAAEKVILQFKKSTPADIETDGWVKTGRVNDSGEELVLTPTDHSPWRSPRTYGDDALPYPPVRSRSDQQAEGDIALGFPPLLGDRNIPPGAGLDFQTENVLEEKARVTKAPSKTPAKAISRPSAKIVSTNSVKHTSKAVAKGTPKSVSKSSKIISKNAPKSTPKSTLKSTPKSAPKPATKTPTKTSTKTTSSAPATKVQRITLKLGPAPESENEPTSDDSESSDETSKQPVVAKVKKRKADVLFDEDEPKPTVPKKRATEKSTSVKSKTSANLAPITETSTTVIIPTGRGRGSSRAAPRGSRGSRGSRVPRGAPISRGRGRGRGSGTATATTTAQPAGASATTTSGSTNFTRGKQGEARAARGPGRARGRGRARGGA
ncbi:hypothetical protein N7476_007444 [Penicillium atrosanguineum]|uniref:Uncharacterized protein n=1 Tax=Penicillium atrosanguineum TaxID=1132637 RepID=A0A9W9PUI1_9EURO|nr:hypothetical protein N7476_007444 [Penicillium atrosanguineum]